MNKIETTILKNLIYNDEYARKVVPFIKTDYFLDNSEKIIFENVIDFIKKYNKCPTLETIEISLQNSNLTEGQFNDCVKLTKTLVNENSDIQWLYDETEKFCKEKAVYNSILQSIGIIEGKDKVLSKDSIPSLLQEALSVSFDPSVGHDFFEDADERYDSYIEKEDKIPFDLDMFNEITDGGLPDKSLNIVLAGTGVGKSLFMCHHAASVLAQGKNVLYVTLEMSEKKIAERIDANLLNIPVKELRSGDLPKMEYTNRMSKLNKKTNGKLIIKEYPTSTAHTGHFKGLIDELRIKKHFVPDILFIDYLNICASSRYKPGSRNNSYEIVKAIAEELRGLAVENSLPVVSATQTTRGGYDNTDLALTDTSESFGVPATADLLFGLVTSDELNQLNQFMVIQMKNRYNDPTINKRFMIGVDRTKMKLYNLEKSAQVNLADSGINMDNNVLENASFKNMFKDDKDFSGIKV